jgi:2-haloacid dehalogenase
MRYRWLLLDADGTLFDYDRAEATALAHTFEQAGHGFQPGYAQVYQQINERMWLAYERGEISQERLRISRFEQLLEAVQVDADPHAFNVRYLKHLAAAAHLIDGAEEVVRALYGRVGMVLITNGLAEVQRSRLARSMLHGYLDAVVISEEAGAAKPDRRIFDVAFAEMDHPRKEDVLIVGDSLTSDIQGGSAYGIDTCWFNPQGVPRTMDVDVRYEIERLGELLNIVQGD